MACFTLAGSQIRLDYQPLIAKGARARESGGNRAHSQIFRGFQDHDLITCELSSNRETYLSWEEKQKDLLSVYTYITSSARKNVLREVCTYLLSVARLLYIQQMSRQHSYVRYNEQF